MSFDGFTVEAVECMLASLRGDSEARKPIESGQWLSSRVEKRGAFGA